MTHTEENKLTMYEAVLSLMNSKKDYATSLPALEKPIWELKHLAKDIKSENNQWLTINNGLKSDLAVAEDNLIENLIHLGKAISVFAKQNRLEDLLDLCSFDISSLSLLSDIELINKSNLLIEKANDNLPELNEFGVNADHITELSNKLQQFKATAMIPETNHHERVIKRWNLSNLFDKADGVLNEKLDNLMESIRENKPEFYNEYVSRRQIREISHAGKPSIIRNLQI